LRAFGLEVPLSLPYPEMIRELTSLFPREERGIKRFFDDMEDISSSMRGQTEVSGGGCAGTVGMSAADYLNGLTDDWKLRRILGSMGSREPYSGLPMLAAMWNLLCEKGIHYPTAGMRHLCDILAAEVGWEPPASSHADISDKARLYSSGTGSMILRTGVVEILVDKGKAAGVILSDGTRLQAKAVVSNADYKATFLRLVPRGAIPEDLHRALLKARQTSSNLQVCLGLSASRVDLSAYRDASRIIYRRDSDHQTQDGGAVDWLSREIDPHALAGEELEATLLSADDPLLSPEGGAVFVIRVTAEHGHFARFRAAPKRRLKGYFAYKTSLANALVKEVSRLAPGLEDAVIYMDVATPLTFEERGGRSEGAVAGWSWDFHEGYENRAREMILTPIAGLYMAGYQAYSMLSLGGVPSAIKSGLLAARYLLEGKGPISEMFIPG
jgi:phytoene dehydrogenase-like protein